MLSVARSSNSRGKVVSTIEGSSDKHSSGVSGVGNGSSVGVDGSRDPGNVSSGDEGVGNISIRDAVDSLKLESNGITSSERSASSNSQSSFNITGISDEVVERDSVEVSEVDGVSSDGGGKTSAINFESRAKLVLGGVRLGGRDALKLVELP